MKKEQTVKFEYNWMQENDRELSRFGIVLKWCSTFALPLYEKANLFGKKKLEQYNFGTSIYKEIPFRIRNSLIVLNKY